RRVLFRSRPGSQYRRLVAQTAPPGPQGSDWGGQVVANDQAQREDKQGNGQGHDTTDTSTRLGWALTGSGQFTAGIGGAKRLADSTRRSGTIPVRVAGAVFSGAASMPSSADRSGKGCLAQRASKSLITSPMVCVDKYRSSVLNNSPTGKLNNRVSARGTSVSRHAYRYRYTARSSALHKSPARAMPQ